MDTTINSAIHRLSDELSINFASQTIPKFSGYENIQTFFNSVEHSARQTHPEFKLMDSIAMKIAYKSSCGLVSNFIARHLDSNQNITWLQLKSHLNTAFGPNTDQLMKFYQISAFKQFPNQPTQIWGEFLYQKCLEIFTHDELKSEFINGQIVQLFIKGLQSSSLARYIIVKNPPTLHLAIKLSLQFEQTSHKLHLLNIEPHPEYPPRQPLSHLNNENFSLRRPFSDHPLHVQHVTTQQEYQQGKYNLQDYTSSSNHPRLRGKWNKTRGKYPYFRFTYKNGKKIPICSFCSIPNHLYRNCHKRFPEKFRKRPPNHLNYMTQGLGLCLWVMKM